MLDSSSLFCGYCQVNFVRIYDVSHTWSKAKTRERRHIILARGEKKKKIVSRKSAHELRAAHVREHLSSMYIIRAKRRFISELFFRCSLNFQMKVQNADFIPTRAPSNSIISYILSKSFQVYIISSCNYIYSQIWSFILPILFHSINFLIALCATLDILHRHQFNLESAISKIT